MSLHPEQLVFRGWLLLSDIVCAGSAKVDDAYDPSYAQFLLFKICELVIIPDGKEHDLADETKALSLPSPKPFRLPFPFPGEVPARFDVGSDDGCFDFLPREGLRDLVGTVLKMDMRKDTLMEFGNVGFGKSHMLAALAVLLKRFGYRVVYLPNLYDMAKSNPIAYLRKAAYFAFADQPDTVKAIVASSTLTEFFKTQRTAIIFIADQWNSVETKGQILTSAAKQQVIDLINIVREKHFLIQGFSANNEVAPRAAVQSAVTHANLGGYTSSEFKAWVGWQRENKQLPPDMDDDDYQRIAAASGRNPLLLKGFTDQFAAAVMNKVVAQESYDAMITAPPGGGGGAAVQDLLRQAETRLHDAIGKMTFEFVYDSWAKKAGSDIYTELIQFETDTCVSRDLKEQYFNALAKILNHAVISDKSKLFDRRYFFVQITAEEDRTPDKAYAVCDLARDIAAFRLTEVKKQWLLCTDDAIATTITETNPSVQGFKAERITLAAISAFGLPLVYDGVSERIVPTGDGLIYFDKGSEAAAVIQGRMRQCAQYNPLPWNYKHVDVLVSYRRDTKTVIIACNCTLTEPAKHAKSLGFFQDAYKVWLGDLTLGQVELHWVWVTRKSHAKASALHPAVTKTHGRGRSDTTVVIRPAFIEHCLAFNAVDTRLDL